MDRQKFIIQYLKDKRVVIGVYFVFLLCSIFMYFLYDVRWEPVLYTTYLIILITAPFIFWDCRKNYVKNQCLKEALNTDFPIVPKLPKADSLLEQNYQYLLRQILEAWKDERVEQKQVDAERDDYYTLWTHQIKTPAYAMDLMLQTGDMTPRKWKIELMKITQYVDMALKYLQLENHYSDLCFKQVELLPMIQNVIKKFSSLFITKQLKVELIDLDGTILTDEKWFTFVIEQLISNAVKYTEQGCVYIYQSSPFQVCIRDTGIGIAAEDLPQLFEKGYTGFNGRIHQKSTGCGLYMCKKVLCMLNCNITISSQLNQGTTVMINLPENNLYVAE